MKDLLAPVRSSIAHRVTSAQLRKLDHASPNGALGSPHRRLAGAPTRWCRARAVARVAGRVFLSYSHGNGIHDRIWKGSCETAGMVSVLAEPTR